MGDRKIEDARLISRVEIDLETEAFELETSC